MPLLETLLARIDPTNSPLRLPAEAARQLPNESTTLGVVDAAQQRDARRMPHRTGRQQTSSVEIYA
jgi:hypothetical protein